MRLVEHDLAWGECRPLLHQCSSKLGSVNDKWRYQTRREEVGGDDERNPLLRVLDRVDRAHTSCAGWNYDGLGLKAKPTT